MGPPWQQAGALGEAYGMTRFGGKEFEGSVGSELWEFGVSGLR